MQNHIKPGCASGGRRSRGCLALPRAASALDLMAWWSWHRAARLVMSCVPSSPRGTMWSTSVAGSGQRVPPSMAWHWLPALCMTVVLRRAQSVGMWRVPCHPVPIDYLLLPLGLGMGALLTLSRMSLGVDVCGLRPAMVMLLSGMPRVQGCHAVWRTVALSSQRW